MGNALSMGVIRNAYNILVREPERRCHLEKKCLHDFSQKNVGDETFLADYKTQMGNNIKINRKSIQY